MTHMTRPTISSIFLLTFLFFKITPLEGHQKMALHKEWLQYIYCSMQNIFSLDWTVTLDILGREGQQTSTMFIFPIQLNIFKRNLPSNKVWPFVTMISTMMSFFNWLTFGANSLEVNASKKLVLDIIFVQKNEKNSYSFGQRGKPAHFSKGENKSKAGQYLGTTWWGEQNLLTILVVKL